MNDDLNKPLQIALSGMESRAYKMMVMFFQGPCSGSAIVVKEQAVAEAIILDGDSVNAKSLLEEMFLAQPDRPVIVLSLEELRLEKIIFVKKPVQPTDMLTALENVREKVRPLLTVIPDTQVLVTDDQANQELLNEETPEKVVIQKRSLKKAQQKKILETEEQKKTSKHTTAMQLDEQSFSSFIGISLDIDFNDSEQLLSASYNVADYYQGFVHSAVNLSISKGRILCLNTAWKPLIIFPHTYELWIDADDLQLKAYSALPAKTIAGIGSSGQGVSVKPVDPIQHAKVKDPGKFQSMDAFLWKLSLWTSKGRFPSDIDISRPVYLKRWPNMTRFVVTPHAMRIAALLVEGPRTLINTAEVLKIKPQYVFIFFSAAYALGLAGQAKRSADVLIAPPKLVSRSKKGIIGKIINALRGT